jgi:hypothetical protein
MARIFGLATSRIEFTTCDHNGRIMLQNAPPFSFTHGKFFVEMS